ncbi:transcriptional regulator, LacI family [Variovorax sp. OK605]|jgi:LacI family transcriptional regulator|uniref:LacI family DNA-binding transcriptional regulator n=1 Tax=unclassified Variovorax TaxID=663243 RepID=UPI0008BBA6C9|nr:MULTISPECIES: LacI family DNA-binding transcriptional regulator [unclassified Variovorax]SEK12430.1 transcriptional regulator, LacI family [Variovorax sp. OK202]SFD81588.1 transcriptional regulator, LacI family [Variovorax sp. OK212]SFP59561.1 transcriptional regulator, LacI family [Variovorax sp. OK605]
MKPKSVGIRDVAKHVGVSTASISRTLNNPESVSPELRMRIDAAIAELGYIPDAAARALSSRRTRTIGAIIPTVDNAMFARGIEALQSYLSLQGYLLLLSTSGYDPETEARQAQNMASRGIDGLILRGDTHTDALRRLLASQRIPFVNVGVYHPDKPYASVGGNNEAAAYRACRYLMELGHTRIGMVAAISSNNDRATARVSGVRRALAESGLALRPEWYIEVPYHLDDARQGARALLSSSREQWPTAVVCGNDVIAYGVLLEAERRGLNVPNDLSVMGFDDLEWSRHLRPSLTTMHVPTDEVWTRAGEYLVKSLAGRPAALHHEVDVSLVVRESTSRPRA